MDRTLAALFVIGCVAAACSPTFNWREVRTSQGGLAAMLPCKPESGERTVPMAGRQVNLQALSCSTGGATFGLLTADVEDAARAGEVLAQWKSATLANLHSPSAQESAFAPPARASCRNRFRWWPAGSVRMEARSRAKRRISRGTAGCSRP
jgi:hypothetical protein